MKPDEDKVKAIREMPVPQDKKAVQRFLGMVNYVGKFIPSLSEETAALRQLTLNEVEWHWSYEQSAAFNKLKKLITSDPVLRIFDPKLPVVVSVDSSQNGMGAVLEQNGHPIEYSSKALTPTQERYAQIEKELLAIVFGLERFHQYVYGTEITVNTDHKPLEAIAKKALYKAPPRIQRLLLRLQRNPYAQIVYVPGKDQKVADALSRAFLSDNFEDENLDAQVHAVISTLPMPDQKLNELREATDNDEGLQALRDYILVGWPSSKPQVPPSLHEYWNFRDELAYIDRLILKGTKLVIPSSMRSDMLSKIHAGHMGMEKCKSRARDVLYWPRMNAAIEDLVSKCPVCLEGRNSQSKEPMIPHEVPQRPWEVLGTDIFTYKGNEYLLVVDYYSRYPEVALLRQSTSKEVIMHCKAIFARHGIPSCVKSDNGPGYASAEFADFAKNYGFSHMTSSPRYPQSNGLAERTVQTIKNLLKKASDPYLGLLEYRNTPIDNIASPAQMLMSRHLRSAMPCTAAQLRPSVVDPRRTDEALKWKQAVQKRYYDRTSRPLSNLHGGQVVPVQLQPQGKWFPGVVRGKADAPRSYVVDTENGTYRRNRRHIMHTDEPITSYLGNKTAEDNMYVTEQPDVETNSASESPPSCEQPSTRISLKVQSPSPQSSPKTTRCGRVVRKPLRFLIIIKK